MYINRSGALLERMAASGVDIVSVDWTGSLDEAKKRIGSCNMQGNLDPAVLLGPDSLIVERTEEILRLGKGQGHVMNLGHGIDANTPESSAKLFVDTVHAWRP